MATSFPGGLDSFTNPGPDDFTADEIGGRTLDEFIADLCDGMEAVQTELGTDPAGSQTTVKARIAAAEKRVFRIVIDGAGAEIADGAKKVYLSIPVACTINKVRLLADVAGAIVVDIWQATYANFPPVNADSITASAPPTITATNQKSEDSTLTGWDVTLDEGSVLEVNVDSCTTITKVYLDLFVTVT